MSDYTAESKPLSPDFTPPEPAAPEASETETWQGPSQDEWQQMVALQQQNAETFGWLQEQAQALQQQQTGRPQIDPFADDFQNQLDSYIDSRLGPYAQMRDEVIFGEAEERAQDIIRDLEASRGDFLKDESRTVARAMAERFLSEEQERHGYGPKAAEAALERGYEYARALETGLTETGVERHLNQIKTLGVAPREPGTAAVAVQQHTIPKGGDEMDVVRHYGGYGR